MLKRCCIATLSTAIGLSSSASWSARDSYDFEVSLSVPSRSFYIQPVDPDWIHREQILPWNPATSTLGTLRKHFEVRHDTSAIEARLESLPYLSNGRAGDDIALEVTFNGVVLSDAVEPRQVMSAVDAAIGSRVLLEVTPKPAADGQYRPGNYYGSVLLVFNARAPGA